MLRPSFLFIGIAIFATFYQGEVAAQSTVRSEVTITSFKVDSSYSLKEWVIPNSIQVFVDDSKIEDSLWNFDANRRLWQILSTYQNQFQNTAEIRIEFEAFPLAIRRAYQNRKIQELDSSFYDLSNDSLNTALLQASSSNTFDDSDLEQSGSLSRGIIVGTNQDFALESGLQFELNGQLTDDVSINASLTDRSIPIQPDGTTQNLREFDKVFIQLQSENTTLEMGDVDVSFEQSTFARLNRRLQGASGYTNTKYGDYRGALSIVRGTFKSLSFEGEDGVQGPYRLSGRDGEEFIIVLAGTERVYINGQEVDRGEENDYIIDYGLGEVFFTNNLLIKDETRIVVEYEYIDQNFNRTLLAAEANENFFNGKFTIGASIIRQADGDELLSQQSLSKDDIDLLKAVGDNLDTAVVPGERLAGDEDDENIRYVKIDTTYNGDLFTIFKNIPNSQNAQYIVRFSKTEDGSGSYNRVSGAVNGLLYEWVGPGLGEYEPFRKLPAPEQQQMVAITSTLKVAENFELFGEWAASSFDKNRFSSIDDDDNNDFSYLSGLKLNNLSSGIGTLKGSISRRYSGDRFSFFERTQDVEFERKWNIARNGVSEEVINEATLELKTLENTSIAGEYGLISRNDFKGYRQGTIVRSNEEDVIELNYIQDWVLSEDVALLRKGEWFRQSGAVSKKIFDTWTPYFAFEQEKRIERTSANDSLLNTSFSFYELGPGLRYKSSLVEIDASIVYRSEKGVVENSLEDESSALEQRLRFFYRPNDYINTRNEISIRSKEFTRDFELQGNSNKRGLLLRSTTDYETESDFLNGQLFYEANTERRALLQEAYIEVGSEIGQYVWIDSNEDGVQQIDEFFLELSPNEGTFIRQFLPSDDLMPVIDLKARFRNEMKPFLFFKGENAFDKFIQNIKLRSRVDISENSTTEELSDVYLLRLNTFRNDSNTVQGRILWEQEMNFFSEIQKIDLVIGYNQNRNLNRLSTESQRLFGSQFYLNNSVQLNNRTKLTTDFSISQNESLSDRITSRNFEIKSFMISPGAQVVINRSWQSSLNFSYSKKEDFFPANPVQAKIIKVINSHRAFLWRKLQTNGRLELRNSMVDGSSSTVGAFELTEGTGIGINLLWTISGNYRVSDLIRLSFNYDGRTVKDRANIHTAKITVSAVF